MEDQAIQLLLIEDNPIDALLLEESLSQSQATRFQLTRAERLADALALLSETSFDLILVDLSLPDSQGLDIMPRLHDQAQHTPIVVLTGIDDERLSLKALQQGAQDYLVKGQSQSEEIARSIRHAIERKLAEEKIHTLNQELAQLVLERTKQMENANKELAAFAYTIAHDLRAPLRAIDGYTSMLVEDYKHMLDADGQRMCDVIQSETQRMGQMIDSLLAFARLSHAEMRNDTIDMERLARQVFDELTQEADRSRLDFDIKPLPPAHGDPTLLRQVWANLLSNAIKFSSKRERAIIQVRGSRDDEALTYCIQDNGAGFDMRYSNKLFGVFQRLHGEDEFPGTGVGLASVQRIIARHSGRIWAESAVNQGTTVAFTLPVQRS